MASVLNAIRVRKKIGLESEAKVGGEVNVYCGYKYFVLL